MSLIQSVRDKIAKNAEEIKRVLPDLALLIIISLALLSGLYRLLPPPQQAWMFKMLLWSSAFLQAHIVGKLAFPVTTWKDDEETDESWSKIARIALYVMSFYLYAQGG